MERAISAFKSIHQICWNRQDNRRLQHNPYAHLKIGHEEVLVKSSLTLVANRKTVLVRLDLAHQLRHRPGVGRIILDLEMIE
jgi:hypothetical protein